MAVAVAAYHTSSAPAAADSVATAYANAAAAAVDASATASAAASAAAAVRVYAGSRRVWCGAARSRRVATKKGDKTTKINIFAHAGATKWKLYKNALKCARTRTHTHTETYAHTRTHVCLLI